MSKYIKFFSEKQRNKVAVQLMFSTVNSVLLTSASYNVTETKISITAFLQLKLGIVVAFGIGYIIEKLKCYKLLQPNYF